MRQALPILFLVSSLSGLAGCVHTRPPAMSPALAGSCRSTTVRWFAPSDERDRVRLDSWCAGVGQPVLQAATPQNPADTAVALDLDDVTFVSWNVHVGNGDVTAFVTDLRAGLFTHGRPARHFVLMLQEAVRTGDVPAYVEGASGARRIKTHTPHPIDIVEISRNLGLSLIYVPSMRNGDSAQDGATDRGSAILSTLPLVDPTAVELPGDRQRRVAIFAKLSLPLSETWPISVGVVHLDALGASKRLWLFGTSRMRAVQVQSMETVLPAENLVLGADLNTWHGTGEPATRVLARLFGKTRVSVVRNGLGLRVLDYLFFRAAGHWTAHYEVAADDYGSDHRPLVGRITSSSPSHVNE